MELCQQQKRSKEIKEKQPKKSCLKKQPVAIDINITEIPDTLKVYEVTNQTEEKKKCCEAKQPCKSKEVEKSACCKPGCSQRKPCMSCIKKGVKVQVKTKECNTSRSCCHDCHDCPKKLTIKTRCEIQKSEAHEADSNRKTPEKCKKEKQKEDVDSIDYCKLAEEKAIDEGNDCEKSSAKKSNSCKNLKQCPCTSCKNHVKSNNKCEKRHGKKIDDEKCAKSNKMRNSCKTSKQVQQKTIQKDSTSMPSSCPNSLSCDTNCCEENCSDFEQDDNVPYIPKNDVNCCGPQNVSEIPSTRLPSVGSFVVPHISEQTPAPCPCGSPSCGNSMLIFQQAIQSQPYITTKRCP